MQRNFETSFVTQCAPVLAGLKVANLFRWVEPDASAMHAMVERWAAELKPKGVTVSIIRNAPSPTPIWFMSTAQRAWKKACSSRMCSSTCCGKVTPRAACRSAWIIFPGAFAAKQSSRTRLAFSLVIRWKMSLALWQTRAKIIRSAVTGNAMATPLQHKRRLNASANALKFISAVSRAVHRSPGSQ